MQKAYNSSCHYIISCFTICCLLCCKGAVSLWYALDLFFFSDWAIQRYCV